MKVQNISNQNFKGFSNVIFHDTNKGNERCLFIAAKLDNKDGHNDLEEYRAFKKMYDMSPGKIDDDTIVMFYNKISPSEDNLYIGDEPLFWGEELKILPETFSAEKYKIVEDSHMKAYTLMSSLTRRISESEQPHSSKFIRDVKETCKKVFFALSGDYQASQKLVDSATNENHIEMQKAAKEFNTIMDRTMKVFFFK